MQQNERQPGRRENYEAQFWQYVRTRPWANLASPRTHLFDTAAPLLIQLVSYPELRSAAVSDAMGERMRAAGWPAGRPCFTCLGIFEISQVFVGHSRECDCLGPPGRRQLRLGLVGCRLVAIVAADGPRIGQASGTSRERRWPCTRCRRWASGSADLSRLRSFSVHQAGADRAEPVPPLHFPLALLPLPVSD